MINIKISDLSDLRFIFISRGYLRRRFIPEFIYIILKSLIELLNLINRFTNI